MEPARLKMAYITAGAAGMFCGSCMHDNTLAAALSRLGSDVSLIPLYTPIRTDEENVSIDRVFMGGISVYLQEKSALFRRLPSFLFRFLDHPWLIDRLSQRSIEVDAGELGDLTVSMLKGEHGHQRKEVLRLTDWLVDHLKPNLINLSNILIAGSVPLLKERWKAPVLITLQGDDLFLNGLREPYRSEAMKLVYRVAEQADGFIVYSNYYADYMADLIRTPREKFHVVPLGLNVDAFREEPGPRPADRPPTVGFLARLCPAKGFHVLTDAFRRLRRMPGTENMELRAAGWLGAGDRKYFEEEVRRLEAEGLGGAFHHAGVIAKGQKRDFLRSVDVLSVPTTYQEPKGIFALEALANGVPVVLPEHGAFPEMLAATGGGRLVRPNDPQHLAETLHALLTDSETRQTLGNEGRQSVLSRCNADVMARNTLAVLEPFLTLAQN